MSITELVKMHGLNIWVWCDKKGYSPFQVIKRLKAEKYFKCVYEDGREFELYDCLNDYVLIDSPE